MEHIVQFGITIDDNAIRDFIDENKEEIIEEMKSALVEKVTRTKAYREAVGEALKEV